MRAYTVATVAVALRVRAKWLDNVLSHHSVPGVLQGRQGIARRLTREAVTVLEIARALTTDLGLPLASALVMAVRLAPQASPRPMPHPDSHILIGIDTDGLRESLDERLRQGVEFGPSPRRGRPPGRRGPSSP